MGGAAVSIFRGAGVARWLAAAWLVVTIGWPASAQRTDPVPAQLQGVGIRDASGAQVPLDRSFTTEDGRTVRLAELVRGDRPVLLSLVYYRCPMLCGLVLNAMVDGLRGIPWTPGQQFEVITISIDPLETPVLARAKKQSTLAEYGRQGAAVGWHFLTGREADIRAVADAVGFEYRYDEGRGEYAHAAGLFVLTPDGRLARTIYGIQYDSRTVRLSLAEAAGGRVSGAVERILLFCFHYDPREGSYVLAATRLMRAGGVLTVLVLGVWLGAWWRRELKNRRTGGHSPRVIRKDETA
jgi:protein SCO1